MSCCRASFRASSLLSKHCWKSSSFSSEFWNIPKHVSYDERRTPLIREVTSHLQENQLSRPLWCRAHQLQSFAAADVVQRRLQQAHHRVKVCRFKETLDLLQRLTALQRLQSLLNLSTARERERERVPQPLQMRASSFPNHKHLMGGESDCSLHWYT